MASMSYIAPSTSGFQTNNKIGHGAKRPRNDKFGRLSRRTVSIHILDDDSLLHVFYLCRPSFTDEDGMASIANWRYNGYWWYTLAHVCRRWRNIVLDSANYLDLFLLCTYGTPVANVLAHSPPLPLVLGYFERDRELATEDEEGIIFALKQHDRVRRVRFYNAGTIMQKLILAMNEEYTILECLHILLPPWDNGTILTFPGTFQAPQLCKLTLGGFALPIGSRLLTNAVGLVKLHLVMIHPSTYFYPNTLLRWITFMPHLETLKIYFKFSIHNRDIQRQLTHTPTITPITLPNLHLLNFRGISAYLETLVYRITTPRLEKLEIELFNQLTFSVPRLLRFTDTTENLRFNSARFTFSERKASLGVCPPGETKLYDLGIVVKCRHLDWQVSSMAQISNSLSQIFSAVEHLTLDHRVHSESSEEHDEVDPIELHKLLRPFTNVKTLRIHRGLVRDVSRCLELAQLEDGVLLSELVPQLQELTYYESHGYRAFTSFIDARRNAGRPVTEVRR